MIKGLKPGELGNAADVGRKDAFHVPAVLVTSDVRVMPGSRVRFDKDDRKKVWPSYEQPADAVVDPFLSDLPKPGQAFWAFIVPGLVRDLTHTFEIAETATPEPESAAGDDGMPPWIDPDDSESVRCWREGC